MTNSLLKYIEVSRNKSLDRVPGADAFANVYFSGTTYSLWKAARGPTAQYSKGLVLDAGSGRGAWKGLIARGAERESLDVAPKGNEHVTWIADLMAMPQVPSERYDAVICHQVLEHIPQPPAAIAELFRVLKEGGFLVISVPHLSRQHELPHDYYRFTPNGLKRILEDSGFEVSLLEPYGGLLSFLHHQFSTAFLGIASVFRPLQWICTVLNAPLSVLAGRLDRSLDRSGILTLGVVAVAHKPLIDAHD